ncbi:MAG: type II toxin-antitoxin system PemK/MazF family toxin [Emticicia sp.]|nr:type II toxin-antitoxin system PemK/MazF family toxin [Emticicia sp.]
MAQLRRRKGMATFVKGDIVVLPFPFSDLSDSKRRPALVLANLQGDDIILCQITSKNTRDSYAIFFESSRFDKWFTVGIFSY